MYLQEVFELMDYEIVEEGDHDGFGFVRVSGKLQRSNYVNANKRYYADNLLGEGIKAVLPRIQTKMLLGELDHPFSVNPSRLMTVSYKEASHLIEELAMDGDYVHGRWKTINTPNGLILRNLFKEGVTIGASLRGGGKTADRGTHIEVVSPFRIITYDAVSNPSNIEATLKSVGEAIHEAIDACLLGGQDIEDFATKQSGGGEVLTEEAKFDKSKLHEIVDDIIFDGLERKL